MVVNTGDKIGTETGANEVAQRIFSKLDSFLNRPPLQPKLNSGENSNLALKSTPISQSSSIIKYKENVYPNRPNQYSKLEHSDNSKALTKSPIQDTSSMVSLADNTHGKSTVAALKPSQATGPPKEFTKPAWVSFGSRSRSKISSSSADSKKSDADAFQLAMNDAPTPGLPQNQNITGTGLNDSIHSQSRKSDYRLRYRPTKSPVGTNRGQMLEASLSLAHKFRAEQTHNRSGLSGKLNSSVEKRPLNLFGSGWENKTSQNLLAQKQDDSVPDIAHKSGSSFRQSSFSILKLLTINDNSDTKNGQNQNGGLRHSRTVKSMPRKGVIAGVSRVQGAPGHDGSLRPPMKPDSSHRPQQIDEHHPAEQTVYLDLKTLQPDKGSARGDRSIKRGIVVKEQETDQKPQFSPSSSARAQRVSKFEPNTEEPRRPSALISGHKVSGQVQTAATNKMTETGGIKAIVSMFSHGMNSTISNRKKRINSSESIEPLNLHIVEPSTTEKYANKSQLGAELYKTQNLLHCLKQIVGKFQSSKPPIVQKSEVEKQLTSVTKELQACERMKIAALKIVAMIANRRVKERKKLALRKIWDRAVKTYETNHQSYKS